MIRVNEIFAIHVEKLEAGVPKGCFMSRYIEERIEFSDLGDMILKINHLLQETKQQTKEVEKTCYHSLRDFAFSSNSGYFYLIEVYYMEHSSWQGQLTGTNCPKRCFKSVMDLLVGINQSMQQNQDKRLAG